MLAVVLIVLMSPSLWQSQNLCRLNSSFITDWILFKFNFSIADLCKGKRIFLSQSWRLFCRLSEPRWCVRCWWCHTTVRRRMGWKMRLWPELPRGSLPGRLPLSPGGLRLLPDHQWQSNIQHGWAESSRPGTLTWKYRIWDQHQLMYLAYILCTTLDEKHLFFNIFQSYYQRVELSYSFWGHLYDELRKP